MIVRAVPTASGPGSTAAAWRRGRVVDIGFEP
jgi:hypothetical protein